MLISWEDLAHRCLEMQIRELHEGTFDPKAAIKAPPGSSWNSFVCSTALSILREYVDSLYFTSKPPTDFCRLEQIFVDSMQLEVHPELKGDRLYFFGQSKPCICVPQLQRALGCQEDGISGGGALTMAHCAGTGVTVSAATATAIHEVRLCVLLAALAICQMSLTSQYARGFALMVKSTLGEVRAARVHSTSDTVQRIAQMLGDNVRVLDMLDNAFDAVARSSLQKLEANSRGGGSGSHIGLSSASTTPRCQLR